MIIPRGQLWPIACSKACTLRKVPRSNALKRLRRLGVDSPNNVSVQCGNPHFIDGAECLWGA